MFSCQLYFQFLARAQFQPFAKKNQKTNLIPTNGASWRLLLMPIVVAVAVANTIMVNAAIVNWMMCGVNCYRGWGFVC